MTDFLNTAVSGLLAAQRQLATTSHNIANISTEGFSRQRVGLKTQTPQAINQITEGKGVIVGEIGRVYDAFTAGQIRDVGSEQKRLDMIHTLASVVDDMLADARGGITPVLQSFFSAAQDVADDPNSTAARTALLDQARALTARFGYMDDRMQALQTDLTKRTQDTIDDINQLAASLFETNQDLLNSRGITASPPPDLLDRRDLLLQQISEKVPIKVVETASGTVDVFVGQGQSLITGLRVNTLSATQSAADPTVLDINIQNNGGPVNITPSITGGDLGGILEFRNTQIDEVRNSLGRLAMGISTLINQQHRDGMDQNGALGADFFSVGGPQVLTNSGNTGAATATAVVSSISALTIKDYTVRYDGANWTLASKDGASTVTGAGPALSLDGVTVTIGGGAAAAGDSFIVKPTLSGASTLAVAVTRTQNIAAASPIRTGASLANTGDAAITKGSITAVGNANLLNPVTIRFNNPATTYDILNTSTGAVLSAAQAYTSGSDINFNGWRVQINGTPNANDSFTVESNTSGVADNSNMLAIANLQNVGSFNSGNTSFQEAYSSLVADVGSTTRLVDINRSTQEALRQTLDDRREAISGVNLDEEAADLVRFQQAYQAAARTISTAQQIFQALIGAF